ncbi:unnamed protein product, partial [Nesidiocoris tenuis]
MELSPINDDAIEEIIIYETEELRDHEVKPRTKFECHYCDALLATQNSLRLHIRCHTGEKPFQCSYCDYAANSSDRLRYHLRTHTNEKPHACNYCDFRTSTSRTLKEHERRHTNEKPYECNFCDYAARSSSGLRQHIKNNHNADREYPCRDCDFIAANKRILIKHSKEHRKREKTFYQCYHCPTKTTTKVRLKEHIWRHTGKSPHKCELCGHNASSQSHLATHMYVHTGEKPFACNYCDFRARKASNVKMHERTHLLKGDEPIGDDEPIAENGATSENESIGENESITYEIVGSPAADKMENVENDDCYDSDPTIVIMEDDQLLSDDEGISDAIVYFVDKNPLKEEAEDDAPTTLVANPRKKYECEVCHDLLATRSSLRLHLTRHTGERPYKCPYCDHATSTSRTLKEHERRHTNEKPYRCKYCDYGARSSSGLRQHIRNNHTGERKYPCGECDFRAVNKRILSAHKKTHREESRLFFYCNHCPTKTTTKVRLKEHIWRHTGQSPHKCKVCGHNASSQSHLASNVVSGVKKQADTSSIKLYKMVDLK